MRTDLQYRYHIYFSNALRYIPILTRIKKKIKKKNRIDKEDFNKSKKEVYKWNTKGE